MSKNPRNAESSPSAAKGMAYIAKLIAFGVSISVATAAGITGYKSVYRDSPKPTPSASPTDAPIFSPMTPDDDITDMDPLRPNQGKWDYSGPISIRETDYASGLGLNACTSTAQPVTYSLERKYSVFTFVPGPAAIDEVSPAPSAATEVQRTAYLGDVLEPDGELIVAVDGKLAWNGRLAAPISDEAVEISIDKAEELAISYNKVSGPDSCAVLIGLGNPRLISVPLPPESETHPLVDPALFISSYYALLPQNREQAWAMLTPRMQEEGGGREEYERWYSGLQRVEMVGQPARISANVVAAALRFVPHGKESSALQRFAFILRSDSGTWLIDRAVPVP